MRLCKSLLIAVGIFSFAACNSSNTDKVIVGTPDSALVAEPVETRVPGAGCFLRVQKGDSLFLQIRREGDRVTGKLHYKNFEKDSNIGTILGQMRGDTLLADYTFNSEGMESVRQVVFLFDGTNFSEGYGDMQEKDGKTIFSEKDKLNFSGGEKLKPMVCPPAQ